MARTLPQHPLLSTPSTSSAPRARTRFVARGQFSGPIRQVFHWRDALVAALADLGCAAVAGPDGMGGIRLAFAVDLPWTTNEIFLTATGYRLLDYAVAYASAKTAPFEVSWHSVTASRST